MRGSFLRRHRPLGAKKLDKIAEAKTAQNTFGAVAAEHLATWQRTAAETRW